MKEKQNLDQKFSIWLTQSWKKVLGTACTMCRYSLHGFFMSMEMKYIGFMKLRDPFKNDLPFPSPHQSMLQHFGKLLETLPFLNIELGRGGAIFHIITVYRSKTFFENCLSRLSNLPCNVMFVSLILKLHNI